MKQIKAHKPHHFPRRTRRGASMMLALILGLAFAIPSVQILLEENARQRDLDVIRGQAIELSTALDQIDQLIYEAAQDATHPFAAWLDGAGDLITFAPPASLISNNRLTDTLEFYTYHDPSTGVYFAAARIDLAALEGFEENAVLEALSILGRFEDGDFEEAARRFVQAGGASFGESQYVIYAHRFNGLDENYMFRQARAREQNNAIAAPDTRGPFDLAGHSLRAASLVQTPNSSGMLNVGGSLLAATAVVESAQVKTGTIRDNAQANEVIQSDLYGTLHSRGELVADHMGGTAAMTAPKLTASGLDRTTAADRETSESRILGATMVMTTLSTQSASINSLTAQNITVTGDIDAQRTNADALTSLGNAQINSSYATSTRFTTLTTSNCLGC